MIRCPKLTEFQLKELASRLKHPTDSKEAFRIQAILLVDQEEKVKQIRFLTGLGKTRAFTLRKLYQHEGITAIKSKPKNPKRLLTKSQRLEITKILKDPSTSKRLFGESFWTTGLLGKYINDTYGVLYKSKTSYYLIFRESKFSFHKPGTIAIKHNQEEIDIWRKEHTQKIQEVWNDPDTIILCEDEAILSTQTTTQRVWLPQNEYPKVETTTKRVNKSIYGFLNVKTGREHAFAYDRQNMYTTVKALQAIRRIYPKRENKGNKLKSKKLLILWDNPGWHRGSKVAEYLEKDTLIEMIWLPKYAPEENPQEHVWKKGKEAIVHNRTNDNILELTRKFLVYLNNTRFPYKLFNLQS